MNRLSLRAIVIILSILFLLMTVFLYNPLFFGVCFEGHFGDQCVRPHWLYGSSMFPLFAALVVFSSMTYFASELTYRIWSCFTIVYGCLVAAVLTLDLIYGVGPFHLDTPVAAMYMAWLYVFIALPLLVITELLTRRKSSGVQTKQ